MKPACSDATGTNRNTLNTQAGSHHDARQDPDAGRSRSTQQHIPTVSVDNDRQTMALPAQFFPPQQDLTSQIISSTPPGQLSASQPVLRGLEAAESAHGSGNGQMDAPGRLASQELGLTSCTQSSMITGKPILEQGSESGRIQATLDKVYRNALSAWVESAGPTERAAHQHAEMSINAYLDKPAEQRWLINLSSLGLSSLPPLPADLKALHVDNNKLTALPEHMPQGLQQLDVSHNQLTALPEHMPQGLQRLDVSYNELTALPDHLPQGLQELCVVGNQLTALPEHMPQGLQQLEVSRNRLTALPDHLPQGLQKLYVDNNELTGLPEHLPQGLQELFVSDNKLTALPKHLPQNLKCLFVQGNGFKSETLLTLMRTNTSITALDFNRLDIDAGAKQALAAELVNNRERPARLPKAAVTLDLLTRFALTTSDQTGALIKRDSTPNPVADQLPGQPIPAELHDVLAANFPKDVLAVLAGMVKGAVQ